MSVKKKEKDLEESEKLHAKITGALRALRNEKQSAKAVVTKSARLIQYADEALPRLRVPVQGSAVDFILTEEASAAVLSAPLGKGLITAGVQARPMGARGDVRFAFAMPRGDWLRLFDVAAFLAQNAVGNFVSGDSEIHLSFAPREGAVRVALDWVHVDADDRKTRFVALWEKTYPAAAAPNLSAARGFIVVKQAAEIDWAALLPETVSITLFANCDLWIGGEIGAFVMTAFVDDYQSARAFNASLEELT